MGRLHVIGKVSVRVYANDHLPPHFHIVGVDAEALVALSDFAILAGEVPDTKALVWAKDNRSTVVAEWNRINPRFPTT